MQENNKQTVFVAGLGSTGSSALIDLLKEVSTYYVWEQEFRLFVDPGGLVNLRDAMVDNWSVFQTDIAIKNFRKLALSLSSNWRSPNSHINHSKYLGKNFINYADNYIDSITDIKFKGIWYGIDNIWIRQLHKLPIINKFRLLTKQMYVGKKLTDSQFNEKTYNFIKSIVNYCVKSEQKANFCFNENLSCMFPDKILKMVPGGKIINIIRDPKDVYADSIRVKWLAIPKNKNEYIKWQMSVYKGYMEVEEKARKWDPDSKSLKTIKFEDLIQKYDDTVEEIFQFLEIDKNDHKLKKSFLNPSLSLKNIGQWKTILSIEEIEFFDKNFKDFYINYHYPVN